MYTAAVTIEGTAGTPVVLIKKKKKNERIFSQPLEPLV